MKKRHFEHSQGLFSVDMKMLHPPSGSAQAAQIRLGVVLASSAALHTCRRDLEHSFGCMPYAETLYSFPRRAGLLMAHEQIYTARSGVVVARAFLDFVLQERSAQRDNMKKLSEICFVFILLFELH